MPQMAPLSWLCLFILFVITFVLFNIVNYFTYSVNPFTSLSNKEVLTSLSLNWMW
nr:ATP synthase F0 subunit 8 [Ephemerella notata]